MSSEIRATDPELGPEMLSVSNSPQKLATVPLRRLLDWGRSQLERSGVPPIEALWLAEWATGNDALAPASTQVGIRVAEIYRSAVAQRRAHIPFQHITGQMQFRYLTLKAGPGVFCTRPETEMLVEYALEAVRRDARPEGQRLSAVDLCSGSGAIGLALASELSGVDAWLVENSADALSYLNANVDSVDLGSSTATVVAASALEALSELEGTLDLVLSNPPYVGVADAPTQTEALQDPPEALYGGGEDGLVIPRGIVGRAYALLRPGGVLLMEHGGRQGAALREHASSIGFAAVTTKLDLAGRPRFLAAQK